MCEIVIPKAMADAIKAGRLVSASRSEGLITVQVEGIKVECGSAHNLNGREIARRVNSAMRQLIVARKYDRAELDRWADDGGR